MIVSDLMTREPASISPSETLADAAGRMWEQDCGALPVVQDGTLVGMITDRDICMACWSRGASPLQIAVGDAMSTGLISCNPIDPVTNIERLMGIHQVRRLPVINDAGRLVGVISLADIARRNAADEVGLTLAGICQRAPAQRWIAAQVG